MPIKLTVPHYYKFGTLAGEVGENLVTPSSWDALRLKKTTINPFAIPDTKSEWIENCESNSQLQERGRLLSQRLRELGVSELLSIGSGGACLEYHLLSNMPELKLQMTDFAPLTVERMKSHFEGLAQYQLFNMTTDSWSVASQKSVLFSRIDSELSNIEWVTVLKSVFDSNVRRILFIPTEFLKTRSLARSLVYALTKKIGLTRTVSRAGYLRNRAAFIALFHRSGFVLRSITPLQDVELWEVIPKSDKNDRANKYL
jgi:hypothetical protein